LLPVTGSVTAKYGSELEFIIMADDDWKSDGNPGFTAAREGHRSCTRLGDSRWLPVKLP
jgi:phage/plasmid primase-like uncharacterized protein